MLILKSAVHDQLCVFSGLNIKLFTIIVLIKCLQYYCCNKQLNVEQFIIKPILTTKIFLLVEQKIDSDEGLIDRTKTILFTRLT